MNNDKRIPGLKEVETYLSDRADMEHRNGVPVENEEAVLMHYVEKAIAALREREWIPASNPPKEPGDWIVRLSETGFICRGHFDGRSWKTSWGSTILEDLEYTKMPAPPAQEQGDEI